MVTRCVSWLAGSSAGRPACCLNAPYYLLRGGYLTDSSLSHERIYGYYWSSTHRNTGAVGASYTLYFRSGYVDISIDDIGGGYHYNGFSVRCVAAG